MTNVLTDLHSPLLFLNTTQKFLLSEASIEIITCTDPVTGKPIQKVVKSVVDPDTGNVYKVVNTLDQDQSGNVQVVTRQDPLTGNMIQELVNIVLDENGQPMQVPVDLPKGIHLKKFFQDSSLSTKIILQMNRKFSVKNLKQEGGKISNLLSKLLLYKTLSLGKLSNKLCKLSLILGQDRLFKFLSTIR